MPGKHHLADRLPQRVWTVIGGVLALAFVAGMVLLVQNNHSGDTGTAVFEQPRSAAVVSAANTPSRTVSSLPPAPSLSAAPPAPPGTSSSRVVGVEPQTRPAAPTRTEKAPAPAPTPPRTSAAPPPRPASAIAATYAVGSSWDTGFIGSVEVRNTSRTDQNFTISVRHDDSAGVRVVTAWNATLNRQGDTSVFTGGPVAPGATVRVGFEATKQVPGRVRPAGCTASSGSCRVS